MDSHTHPVVVRIFGKHSEEFIDRRREKIIMQHLSKRHLGPTILATFPGGRIETFIPGITLKARDLRDPSISQAIARALRTFHDTRVPELSDTINIWHTLEYWLEKLSSLTTHLSLSPYPSHQDIKTLLDYYKRLRDLAEKHHPAQILSHNDLVAGNIIRSPQSKTHCTLIDVEYSTKGPRGFDIANLFRDWLGFGTHQYAGPTLDEKRCFATAYLGISKSKSKSNKQDAVTELVLEAERCYPITDLYWGVWCLLKSLSPSPESSSKAAQAFDYAAYAHYRLTTIESFFDKGI